MKWLLLFAIFALVAVGFVGCRRVPAPTPDNFNPAKNRGGDPIEKALATFRYPENPRTSDDATRYRDGLQLLSGIAGRAGNLSDEERKFLVNDAHLTDDELAEVEAAGFRPADAHHLDECFSFRDAARSIEAKGVGPIAQADADFQWVMRNVLLHDQVDDWTPPAVTLRRGYGNAVDRALVFLAMLRQSQREGCLVVVPGTDPLQFLVAVLGAENRQAAPF